MLCMFLGRLKTKWINFDILIINFHFLTFQFYCSKPKNNTTWFASCSSCVCNKRLEAGLAFAFHFLSGYKHMNPFSAYWLQMDLTNWPPTKHTPHTHMHAHPHTTKTDLKVILPFLTMTIHLVLSSTCSTDDTYYSCFEQLEKQDRTSR